MARPLIRVLLVEDEQSDADYILRMLKRAEEVTFEVERVVSLKSALQVIELEAPDIALLDLSLPDSHGYDTVVEFVKHLDEDVPFVVLTGNDDMSMAMRCVGLGAQDYILKNEIQPKPLERALIVVARRNEKARTRRQLEHKSREMVFDNKDHATVSMIRAPVSQLLEAFEDLRRYLDVNAPNLQADVQTLLGKYDVDSTVQVIRDTLRLHADRKSQRPGARPKQISDAALKAVDSVIGRRAKRLSSIPADAAEADAMLLDIMKRREAADD